MKHLAVCFIYCFSVNICYSQKTCMPVIPNGVGEIVHNQEMLDTLDQPVFLHNVEAAYTFLIFWSPENEASMKQLLLLDSFYRAKWKAAGVKVFAALNPAAVKDEKEMWLAFINDHKLFNWINVYKTVEAEKEEANNQLPRAAQWFDVIKLPTMLLLDKHKKIIAKKLTLEQYDEILGLAIKSNKPKQ